MTAKPILESMRVDADKLHLLLTHAMERDNLGSGDLASLRELLDNLTLRFAELRNELEPAAGGQNLSAGEASPVPQNGSAKGGGMINEKLTHGVEIRSRDAERAVVMIEVPRDSDDFDTATILSRAWACLAEAISDHKGAVEASRAATAPEAGQQPAHAPGSGAWWEG